MKILITSGCSFSDPKSIYPMTWPNQLSEFLGDEYESIHTGRSSQGNGLISRKLIYTVQKALENNTNPNDILVGIMWSGPNRYDFHNDSDVYKEIKPELPTIENPTGFVDDKKNWIIFNHHWNTVNCQTYYKNFTDPVFCQLTTIEHILRTQWFLERNNIKYFMSMHMDTVLSKELITHPEISYLYKQINFNTFLPIDSQLEWCTKYSNLDLPDNMHPSTEQNKKFTDDVIIPFLKEKQYI